MLGLSDAPDVYLRLTAIVFAALVAAAALHLIRALIDATENAERHARAHRCTIARNAAATETLVSDKAAAEERTRAELARRVEAEAQVQAEREMSAYLFHEFRADLQGIGSAVLRWSAGETVSPSLAAAARASILHCKELAANVMDVAKFNSGELVLAQEDVDVRALCEEVHQTMSIAYPTGDGGDEGDAGRPAAVVRRVVCPAGLYVKGSPRHLRQILRNLFSNACKFTERGSIVIEASPVAESPSTVDVRFSVCDTGCGIVAEDQQKVFRKFQQVSTERGGGSGGSSYDGTGMGLPLSQGFVELMGGTLELASPWITGDGSVVSGTMFHFTVTFPRGQATKALDNGGTGRADESSGCERTSASATQQRYPKFLPSNGEDEKGGHIPWTKGVPCTPAELPCVDASVVLDSFTDAHEKAAIIASFVDELNTPVKMFSPLR